MTTDFRKRRMKNSPYSFEGTEEPNTCDDQACWILFKEEEAFGDEEFIP